MTGAEIMLGAVERFGNFLPEQWPCELGDHNDCVGQTPMKTGGWRHCPCECHTFEDETSHE